MSRRLEARLAGASAALALVLVLCSCGAGSLGKTSTTQGASAQRASARAFEGAVQSNPAPEPPLVLRDYLGRRVDVSRYLGKAVLVTFLYTHCPDTCPLITAKLRYALAMLGVRADTVQIIAVSTDPRGDTASTVTAFLARHHMTGRMEYLIGSRAALASVWRGWGVSATNPTADDRVSHGALVYGITASGRLMTAYPPNFDPTAIAHDVPRLASM